MVSDLIRDSTFGQIVNRISNGKLLPYVDQRAGFTLPSSFEVPKPFQPSKRNSDIISNYDSEAVSNGGDIERQESIPEDRARRESTIVEQPIDLEKISDPFMIDWDGEDDPDNPR